MTTATWTSTIAHASDANFRAWGSELSAKLAAIGMVQTADTGQINWTTVTRPGINTAGGYEIWRFADTLQATAPVYLKIEYGTGAGATTPGLWLTVGTSSNGSGTITGSAISTRSTFNRGTVGASSYTSYACYKDGCFSLVLKMGSSSSAACAACIVCRTADGAGAWTATGAVVYTAAVGSSTVMNVQSLRFAATASAFSQSAGGYCMVPHGQTGLIGTDNPIHLHWMPIPETVPVLGVCTHIAAHYSLGTFTATLIGATPRTYFTTGSALGLGPGSENGTSSTFAIAMLWE